MPVDKIVTDLGTYRRYAPQHLAVLLRRSLRHHLHYAKLLKHGATECVTVAARLFRGVTEFVDHLLQCLGALLPFQFTATTPFDYKHKRTCHYHADEYNNQNDDSFTLALRFQRKRSALAFESAPLRFPLRSLQAIEILLLPVVVLSHEAETKFPLAE